MELFLQYFFLPLVSESGLIKWESQSCTFIDKVALWNQIGGIASIGCCALVYSSYNHMTRKTIKSSYTIVNLKVCCCSIVAKVITTAADFAISNLQFLETVVRLALEVTRKNDRDLMEAVIHYNCMFSTYILGMLDVVPSLML